MKPTKVALYILALICIVLIGLLIKDKRECESCHQKEQQIIRPTEDFDFSLKIDCTNQSNYQVFQYDIANGYSVMGQIKLDSNNNTIIEKIDFTLYEAGTCKRFGIGGVSYEKHESGHIFDIIIESRKNADDIHSEFARKISVAVGQNIFIRIKSEDFPNLRTYLPTSKNSILGEYENKGLEGIVRHFPPLICPAKIYEGIN
ncbi:hypothetical protein [Maribacter sp. 2307UL18-2]|uniref:hypothetical protein n=1 Tax=Maribacter sp. 2307UL18-2 TaxID=3386274 RepID=UPI0039BCD433